MSSAPLVPSPFTRSAGPDAGPPGLARESPAEVWSVPGSPAGGLEPLLPVARDAGVGLSDRTVEYLSGCQREPGWLRDQRLAAWRAFAAGGRTTGWAPPALADLAWAELHGYSAPPRAGSRPGDGGDATRAVLDRLGVGREEADFLGGAQAQIDGGVVHGSLREEWARAGVIFTDAAHGLTDHGRIFRPHFGSVVGRDENFLTRLNAALFAGGAFIYVPPGVKVVAPLKCFMHLQAGGGTQFGRTLVVAGAGAEVTFFESCTSVQRPGAALHGAVGEFVAGPGARINYVALQKWTPNVFNLAILRARVAAGASVHWIDCNVGGRLTMKFPCALLEGEGASAEAVSISVARTGQHHDTGAKMFHRASHTSSTITSKSVSLGAGRAGFRGWVDMPAAVEGCHNHTECDALLVDACSRSDTSPAIQVRGQRNSAAHEASVSRLSAEQIFYMRQRGLSEADARSMSVNGFINDLVARFPLQYSLEIWRLIELEMSGSVG